MKKAVVIGSTGMVGAQLISLLLSSSEYSEIISLVRRPSGVSHPKLHEHVVDFDKPETWQSLVSGQVLFSCLGTTLAQAGSKEKQYKIDFDYQYEVARIAAENKIESYILISAAGANSKSTNFYLRMKGQLDDAIQSLPFQHIYVLRPGQLYGNRTQKRTAEKWALSFMFALNKAGLFRKYRPIHATEVASIMLKLANHDKPNTIFTYSELFGLL